MMIERAMQTIWGGSSFTRLHVLYILMIMFSAKKWVSDFRKRWTPIVFSGCRGCSAFLKTRLVMISKLWKYLTARSFLSPPFHPQANRKLLPSPHPASCRRISFVPLSHHFHVPFTWCLLGHTLHLDHIWWDFSDSLWISVLWVSASGQVALNSVHSQWRVSQKSQWSLGCDFVP